MADFVERFRDWRFACDPLSSRQRGNFLLPPPELASCPLEREAWPRNSESPFTNCHSSRPTSSRNFASMSRSIRSSGLPPICSRRCGEKTGTCRSGAMSAGQGALIAHAAYVLARNGRQVMGDLRYLADAKIDSFESPLARAQLHPAGHRRNRRHRSHARGPLILKIIRR